MPKGVRLVQSHLSLLTHLGSFSLKDPSHRDGEIGTIRGGRSFRERAAAVQESSCEHYRVLPVETTALKRIGRRKIERDQDTLRWLCFS
jgi:hypothetical protein